MLLNGPTKFKMVVIAAEIDYRYIRHQDSGSQKFSQQRTPKGNKVIDYEPYYNLCPGGSKLSTMHGQAMQHKDFEKGFYKLRPILCAMGNPAYTLARYLVLVLDTLTKNEYSANISFSLTICKQNSANFMPLE